MPILNFLLHVMGAIMLLLFAVRMVRTGIERSFGPHFQAVLTRRGARLTSAGIGAGMAVLLQSSAAVALLSAGFARTGAVGVATGLAIVLGADLGSAIVVRILSFQLDALVPFLLALGGWLFLKSETRAWRQAGRICLGIRDAAFLPAIANYLATDFVTAFLVGAVLAVIMHSSVAAILICVTMVQIGTLPFSAGVSLVLGANLGSAFIPVWLTRNMSAPARRITQANLGLRGGWALALLLAGNLLPAAQALLSQGTAIWLIYAHIAFNASLLALALPVLSPVERLTTALVKDKDQTIETGQSLAPSSLDPANIGYPALALASLKRELLRMNSLVEEMFLPLPDIYRTGSATQIAAQRAADEQVNACLSGIRDYVATIPADRYSKPQKRSARDMVDYAISLESAGDLVAKRFTALAEELQKSGARFSPAGWSELTALHNRVAANIKLAGNVLISDDLESARLLSLEKDEIKRAERASRKRHLKRLQKGGTDSIETSDIHLETLMALREFNSHISAVAFPILYQNGQLLETRLIDSLPPGEPVAG